MPGIDPEVLGRALIERWISTTHDATLTFTFDCSPPPASVLEAAVDFTDRRSDVFPAVEAEYYRVHSIGDKCADVTEGTGTGIGTSWERCQHSWSTPDPSLRQ